MVSAALFGAGSAELSTYKRPRPLAQAASLKLLSIQAVPKSVPDCSNFHWLVMTMRLCGFSVETDGVTAAQLIARELSCAASINCNDAPKPSAAAPQGG